MNALIIQTVTKMIENTDALRSAFDSVDQSIIDLSVYGNGNRKRLKDLMKRAESGEKLTIATLGGSITAGCHAATKEQRWASLTTQWWRDQFPNAEITHVNAGIGSTGSAIGMFRLQRDVLSANPDLVIVEYSVNDADRFANIDNASYYESIVRRCVKAGLAVLLLFLPRISDGGASREQKRIGEAYDLPMISVVDSLKKCLDEQLAVWKDYGADNVHPNTSGHRFIADLMISYLEDVKKNDCAEADILLPESLSDKTYMEADILGSADMIPASLGGFTVGDDGFAQFKQAWICNAESIEPMVLELSDCKNVVLLYQKTNSGTLGNVKVVVESDGTTEELEIVANNPKAWGDFAAPFHTFASDRPTNVKVSIYPQGAPFRLLRVMIAK